MIKDLIPSIPGSRQSKQRVDVVDYCIIVYYEYVEEYLNKKEMKINVNKTQKMALRRNRKKQFSVNR